MNTIIREFKQSDSCEFLDIVRDLQVFELEIYDRMMSPDEIGQ